MTVVESPAEARDAAARLPGPLVLVPTMGALHAGHIALIDRARKLAGPAGSVAVSIFVNPIQFDRAADLESYPQPLENDLAACRKAGVDLVFAPQAAAMYTADRSVTVTESRLSHHLCGATRPGHFDGVCTVVLKLFMLLGPTTAVFGEKDFQQLAIIRRMVRDLDVAVRIDAVDTIREADGLALSSRNARLAPDHRADAPRIRSALQTAADMVVAGERRAEPLLAAARARIAASKLPRIDYLELVDAESLEPVAAIHAPAVLAAAVFYGEVRLIDHVSLLP